MANEISSCLCTDTCSSSYCRICCSWNTLNTNTFNFYIPPCRLLRGCRVLTHGRRVQCDSFEQLVGVHSEQWYHRAVLVALPGHLSRNTWLVRLQLRSPRRVCLSMIRRLADCNISMPTFQDSQARQHDKSGMKHDPPSRWPSWFHTRFPGLDLLLVAKLKAFCWGARRYGIKIVERYMLC